jgi:hypothetical protein
VDPRTERVGKNEAVFREVNERINDVSRFESGEYHCECGNAACAETVPMAVADYEAVRSDPTFFVVVPGHEIPDLEDVIVRNEAFLVVQKRAGAPAELAAELDSRD